MRAGYCSREGGNHMWETVVPALSVLAAEAVIRRKINALPPETFPLRIGQRVQLRRAYNRGLLCSKLADRPKAAAAVQTASAAVLASMTAVCVFRRSSAVLQVAMGLMLGGALAKPRRALGARCGHGLCVSSAGGHPVFPAHHLERCRSERVCRLPRGDRRAAVRSDVIM